VNLRWAAVAILVVAGCAPRPGDAPADLPSPLAARRAVWAEIQALSAERGVDPGFVYALVKIESDFDPHARSGDARGLLQLKPRVWRSVSSAPYAPQVWDWSMNLRVGMDYLAALKRDLAQRGHFSYRLLWAEYHYGFDYVAARGFDMGRIQRPSDPISFKLYSGDLRPVTPPK